MAKNKISQKVFEKEFKNKESKKAYLNCCKWLAIHVFSKEELSKNLSIQINKKNDKTFLLEIYFTIEEEKLKKDFCSTCQRLYATFYHSEKLNCEECKMRAYHKRNEQYTKGLVNIYEKIFKEIEE